MKTTLILRAAGLGGILLGMVACSGGSNNFTREPDTFIVAVQKIAANSPDDIEPVNIDALVATAPEDTEPVTL
jgi:hypothetical protein